LEDFELFKIVQPWFKFKMTSVFIMLMFPTADMMNETMQKLGNKITNLPSEWRVGALNTVANLLELKVIHVFSHNFLICLLGCC
jgi:hypothetical protein